MACGARLDGETLALPTQAMSSDENPLADAGEPVLQAQPRPGPEASATLQPEDFVGQTVAGYQIESKLGKGAMGAVFLATQVTLKRKVALKVLSPRLSSDAGCTERFQREAQALAKLDHGGIVPVFDMFHAHGLFCIAMGYCAGGSVRDLLKREGKLSERRAADLVQQTARGLWAAAQAGIVHRDIKPDNLLLTGAGRVRIADFGLVKAQPGSDDTTRPKGLTTAGELLGTPPYMSPEQLRGSQKTDHRSDLYSLGCTLFELLTGNTPFQGPTAVNFVEQHLLRQPPDLRRMFVTPTLAQVVARLLEKDPEKRFQTGAELASALQRHLEKEEPEPAGAMRFGSPPRPPKQASALPVQQTQWSAAEPPPEEPRPLERQASAAGPGREGAGASEAPGNFEAARASAKPPGRIDPLAWARQHAPPARRAAARGSRGLLWFSGLALLLGALFVAFPETSRRLFEQGGDRLERLFGDPGPDPQDALEESSQRAAFAAETAAHAWQKLTLVYGLMEGLPARQAKSAWRRAEQLAEERQFDQAIAAYEEARRGFEQAVQDGNQLIRERGISPRDPH